MLLKCIWIWMCWRNKHTIKRWQRML